MLPTNVVSNFKAEALTDDNLRLEAPSIFAPGPMTGLSPRYTFVSTTEIIAGLRDKHWVPVAVEQQRVRTPARFDFQKHLIRFRKADQMHALDEWNGELVLTNSHDAACAYILRVGIYRRLSSNGLVTSGDNFEAIRFRHARLSAEQVIQASYRILESVPKMGALINRFRERRLDEQETLTFARQALLLRYESLEQSPIEPQTLLIARRREDQTNDLSTVYNRCQENLERGGLSDSRRDRRGRLRCLRALRGIDSRITLNEGLWTLAEELVNNRN